MRELVPAPVSVRPAEGVTSTLDGDTAIRAAGDALPVASLLADLLGLPVSPSGRPGGIALLLSCADPGPGDEGYRLDVAAEGVTLRANRPAGLFAGAQTLRQLLPPAVDGPRVVPGGRIVDRPRFAYRGVMLDVCRRFFPVA